MPGRVTAIQLENLIQTGREKAFLIVDVREPLEYHLNHIRVAVNIPITDIEFHPFVYDEKRRVIFYCRAGRRSKVAALIAEEGGLPGERIFNLDGGMMDYSGEILLDIPRVEIFAEELSPAGVMEKAINLEKGAYLFYQAAKEFFTGTRVHPVLEKMLKAEKGHARSIFKMLDKLEPCSMPFGEFFDFCQGDILEGGKTQDQIQRFLGQVKPENKIDILDFALDLEFSAYDLYKAMTVQSNDIEVKEMFFTLAEAEKQHVAEIIDSIDLCD